MRKECSLTQGTKMNVAAVWRSLLQVDISSLKSVVCQQISICPHPPFAQYQFATYRALSQTLRHCHLEFLLQFSAHVSLQTAHQCLSPLVHRHHDCYSELLAHVFVHRDQQPVQPLSTPAHEEQVLCDFVSYVAYFPYPTDLRYAASHLSPSSGLFFETIVALPYPQDLSKSARMRIRSPDSAVRTNGQSLVTLQRLATLQLQLIVFCVHRSVLCS